MQGGRPLRLGALLLPAERHRHVRPRGLGGPVRGLVHERPPRPAAGDVGTGLFLCIKWKWKITSYIYIFALVCTSHRSRVSYSRITSALDRLGDLSVLFDFPPLLVGLLMLPFAWVLAVWWLLRLFGLFGKFRFGLHSSCLRCVSLPAERRLSRCRLFVFRVRILDRNAYVRVHCFSRPRHRWRIFCGELHRWDLGVEIEPLFVPASRSRRGSTFPPVL